eukprot:scpid83338/ scgid31092/ Protein ArsC 2; Arsenate reductase 2; Arsenical pump modifier 2; Low molecular weight protein-tyrosine-phosphatase 2 &gt; Protein ArsC; Arsenate reductase; Arsenical pump modifier; Low molecular weight protein-tyrosine-phosphatase
MSTSTTRVMFVCRANSCRSQMAEGFGLNLTKSSSIVKVVSCGLAKSSVNQRAVAVMKDAGVDISSHRSRSIDEFKPADFDVVISMCGCSATLPDDWRSRPVFRDWNLDDPPALVDGEPGVFERVRDEIHTLVQSLISEISTST